MSSFAHHIIAWLRHLVRTQVLAIIFGILAILAIEQTVYTDSPFKVRRELQLANSSPQPSGAFSLAGSGRVLIRAPAFDQLPALYNGCEVTSLAMLLKFMHIPVTPIILAGKVKKDLTPLVTDGSGNIVSWGNPDVGFVGDITGLKPGYGVNHGPIAALLNKYLPGRAVDLTGDRFQTLLATVRSGRPVLAWNTVNFKPPTNWITWSSPSGPVRATLSEHMVLLVGYDNSHVYVNNPLNAVVAQRVSLSDFRKTWIAMGRQAVTVSKSASTNVR